MKYLHADPEIMGGVLVIRGTRIPIDTLLYRLKDGYTLEDLQTKWSYVGPETLRGAIQEALGVAIDVLNKNYAKGISQTQTSPR
ncbi:MAG: DUF433 domain-containing protein [Acidobacteria bacterium]|nr:DUF433 domain-containing protein [Acidobacteriota bacterium]